MTSKTTQDGSSGGLPDRGPGLERSEKELLELAESMLASLEDGQQGVADADDGLAESAISGPLFAELLREQGEESARRTTRAAPEAEVREEHERLSARCAALGLDLEERAGHGGMGVVYRAHDRVLDRQVAVKTVYTAGELVHGESPFLVRERFRREARTLSKLNHPNICQVHRLVEGYDSLGSEGVSGRSSVYRMDPDLLVLEWVDGETLAEVDLSVLSMDSKLVALEQIAEALASAHQRGIVHRDLKPANVMLRPDGQVKVLDFGIARSVVPAGAVADESVASPARPATAPDAAEGHDAPTRPLGPRGPASRAPGDDLTHWGVVLGTPGYVSPEQLRGDLAGPPSDVWSFGVLAQQLVGYGPVWEDGRPILDQIAEGHSLPARGEQRGLCELIDSCRAPSAQDRPAAAEIAVRLGRLRSAPARRRRRLQLAAAAAVAAVSLIAAVVLPALERRRSAERVRQVQQISRELAVIEADLERETLLPEHSVAAARAAARSRLDAAQLELERGIVDPALGAYAAGRGSLAVGDVRGARPLLEQAWQAGIQEAAVPLGRVLSRLYDLALEDAQGIADPEVREAAVGRARRELQQPALTLLGDVLEAGGSAGPEEALVRRAELLLLRGEAAASLEALSDLQAVPPAQQPRALLTRAQARRRLASQEVRVGEREGAASTVEMVRGDLEAALAIARSSPEISLELCRLEEWNLGLLRDLLGSATVEPERIEPALAACRRAVRIDPDEFEAVRLLADAHRVGAWEAPSRLASWAAEQMAASRALLLEARSRFADNPRVELAWLQHLSRESEAVSESGGDIAPLLEEAESVAERVVAALPGNAKAPLAVGFLSWNRAFQLFIQGQDARAEFERSLLWLQRAVELAPEASNVVNLLGTAQGMLSLSRMQRGEDPRPTLEQCIATFERAIELYPENPYPRGNLGMAYRDLADYASWLGDDPSDAVRRGVEVLVAARALLPEYVDTWLTQSELELALARSTSGDEALAAYRQAEQSARRGLTIDALSGLRLRLAESLVGQLEQTVDPGRRQELLAEITEELREMRRSGTETFRRSRLEARFLLAQVGREQTPRRVRALLGQAEKAARAAVAEAPQDAENRLQLARVLALRLAESDRTAGDDDQRLRREVSAELDEALRLNANLGRMVEQVRATVRAE